MRDKIDIEFYALNNALDQFIWITQIMHVIITI